MILPSYNGFLRVAPRSFRASPKITATPIHSSGKTIHQVLASENASGDIPKEIGPDARGARRNGPLTVIGWYENATLTDGYKPRPEYELSGGFETEADGESFYTASRLPARI